jgi:isoleucyl-tRNA synthetase
LLQVRSLVMLELEAMRAAKTIGKSLEASVTVIATEGSDEAILLRKYESSLAEFFNVSQTTVQLVGASKQEKSVMIEASVAEGSKCGRCWRVVPDVGSDDRWPEVCARCSEALEAIGFAPTQGDGK